MKRDRWSLLAFLTPVLVPSPVIAQPLVSAEPLYPGPLGSGLQLGPWSIPDPTNRDSALYALDPFEISQRNLFEVEPVRAPRREREAILPDPRDGGELVYRAVALDVREQLLTVETIPLKRPLQLAHLWRPASTFVLPVKSGV